MIDDGWMGFGLVVEYKEIFGLSNCNDNKGYCEGRPLFVAQSFCSSLRVGFVIVSNKKKY